MLENKFIFDLQRFYLVVDGVEIEPNAEGTFVVDGTLETLALTEDGSVTVVNDYKFDFTDPTGSTAEVNIKNATGEFTITTNSGVTGSVKQIV